MTATLALSRTICARAGFDHEVVTDTHLKAALRRRQQALGALEPAAYAERLAGDASEQEDLLEELLVRESWFYRDVGPFEFLTQLAALRWQQRDYVVRALSAPCASGEEPYSIAIALAAGGLPLARMNVDALDLSRRGLAAAAAAVYPQRALEKVPGALRERWLRPQDEGRWRVEDDLRRTVQLHHGNLLALPTALEETPYDIVFCRNALIYLQPVARAAVLDALTARLAPDGVLVVGHAEAALLRDRPFRPVGRAGTFAFERVTGATTAASNKPAARAANAAPTPALARPAKRAARVAPPNVSRRQPDGLETRLEIARTLADRGAYPAAAAQVAQLLGEQPDNADAQHLLGLIRAAEGNTNEARQCFQRALYLAPTHLPSLQHLALLAERCGDDAQARLLHQRAARLESRT